MLENLWPSALANQYHQPAPHAAARDAGWALRPGEGSLCGGGMDASFGRGGRWLVADGTQSKNKGLWDTTQRAGSKQRPGTLIRLRSLHHEPPQ